MAAKADGLMALMREAGIAPREASEVAALAPEAVAAKAAEMTVLVSCWE
ncbi:MAG: hypothetical protein AAF919_02335 [Pseudomonadota bacterium]